MGLSSPLPWWIEHISAGRQLGVPPWDVFDPEEGYGEEIPRRFWRKCALIMSEAEGIAEDIRKSRNP